MKGGAFAQQVVTPISCCLWPCTWDRNVVGAKFLVAMETDAAVLQVASIPELSPPTESMPQGRLWSHNLTLPGDREMAP